MNLVDEDDTLTMSAALDFVETIEIVESGQPGDATKSLVNTVIVDPRSSPTENIPPVRRKRTFKQGYSTLQARRKKKELLELRRQVAGLEEWLQHVKDKSTNATELSQNVVARSFLQQQWGFKAMEEFKKLQDAEHTNKKLKHALKTQKKLNAAVLAIVRRRETLSGIDFVFNNPTRDTRANLHLDNTSIFMEQLSSRVSQLYHDCESVFPKERLPTFGFRMEPTVDMYRGRMMEIVARSPVDCPMKQASDALWEDLCRLRTAYRYMTAKGANAVAIGFDMTLQNRFGATDVNGIQYLQRFEEADRVVQIRAYKLLLPTEGLYLLGHAWTVVSKSETDPVHKSDAQFYMQLFVETQEGFSAAEKDIDYVEEVGLDGWSSKMRMCTLWLQEVMSQRAQEYLATISV